MAKATYRELERLRDALVRDVQEFRRDFDETEVELVLRAATSHPHGVEKIAMTVKEIPALYQSILPGLDGDDDVTSTRWRRLN